MSSTSESTEPTVIDSLGVIIAFDPGKIAGVAIYSIQLKVMTQWELPWLEAVKRINEVVRVIHVPTRLVGERWDPVGKRGVTPQLDALEMIGACRYVASQHNVTFELQGRSEAKKITNKTLKELGWHVQTKDGHVDDAARHVAHNMLTHHPVEYLALFAGI